MLQIESENAGQATVLRLAGDIDEDGVPELRVALRACLRAGEYNVVLNMEAVKFISYMGVGVLVERLRQFQAGDGDLKLVGLNLYTQRLFRMVGVTLLFDTLDSEGQALQVFKEAA